MLCLEELQSFGRKFLINWMGVKAIFSSAGLDIQHISLWLTVFYWRASFTGWASVTIIKLDTKRDISPVILGHYSYISYSSVHCVLLGCKEVHPSLPILFILPFVPVQYIQRCSDLWFEFKEFVTLFSFICSDFLGCIRCILFPNVMNTFWDFDVKYCCRILFWSLNKILSVTQSDLVMGGII